MNPKRNLLAAVVIIGACFALNLSASAQDAPPPAAPPPPAAGSVAPPATPPPQPPAPASEKPAATTTKRDEARAPKKAVKEKLATVWQVLDEETIAMETGNGAVVRTQDAMCFVPGVKICPHESGGGHLAPVHG